MLCICFGKGSFVTSALAAGAVMVAAIIIPRPLSSARAGKDFHGEQPAVWELEG